MTDIKRLLIIDDNTTADLICRHFVRKDYPEIIVCSFTEPAKALEFIKNEHNTCPLQTAVLLDINMPVLSGWEVLEELEVITKFVQEHFSIYIFSSSINDEDKELSRNHPLVAGFIEKPLTSKKLATMISEEKAIN